MSMKTDITKYNDFELCNITGETAEEIPRPNGSSYYRVELPYNPNNYAVMSEKGYLFADRTIGVSISLRKNDIDYSKMIRFDISEASDSRDSILDIALRSFTFDRRFHVKSIPDDAVAAKIIEGWVESLSQPYVCIHKDEVVGFLDLEPFGEKDCFIHLAAVKERYRAAGAAVSLYAYAILKAKEKECDKICGRISSGNIAVMNLYARLGGVFSDPLDVFVRNEI